MAIQETSDPILSLAQRPANVQPAPQNGDIKAPPEVTPKMERKLTGSVKLKSTVKYDVHRPSEKEQIDAAFGAEHQRINDQRVAIMIDEIMAGMYEIYDGSIELEDNPEIVEELLRKDLEPQQQLLGITLLEVAVKKLKFKLSQMVVSNTTASEKAQGTITLPGEKSGARGVSANVSISSTIGHEIFKENPKEAEQLANLLQGLHSKASSAQAQHIADEVGAGNIPFDLKKGVQLDHKAQTMDLLKRLYGSVSQKDAKFADIEIHELKVKVDFESLTETEMKIWEVFFDHKDKETGKGKRIDPLILDLNRDGKFDITGANQEGNGKIDGPTVNFDIDPSKQSWRKNSPGTVLVGTKVESPNSSLPFQTVKQSTTPGKQRTSVQRVYGLTTRTLVNLRRFTTLPASGSVNGSRLIGVTHTVEDLDDITSIHSTRKKRRNG